ncbi:hypothetical protein VHEMI07480 [[Torrubiella] hemipterigena]|uniref:Acyltransferase MbtK/IucB-like conserved domain-containing protein n=1 Tax=[Torrubiella] hemipterigena TaxID=1531966 RepID=A0A0A1TLS3_9HYPO|nr:hypothetical protein VHEMI07480 [[Torrubiella] hemipterigena]
METAAHTPEALHLPDGQTYYVAPVFGGIGFRSNDATHDNHFPIGWTTVLHTEEERPVFAGEDATPGHEAGTEVVKKRTKAFKQPTLQNDALFISSISQPSNSEFQPPASPTRQIAMMLWVTLYWYFHQKEPEPYLHNEHSKDTPHTARPTGEWSIMIKREGIFRSKNLIPKLERMGLIATKNTAVGTELDDSGDMWSQMFVSQSMFWQIPPNLFLFTLKPVKALPSYASPTSSRPGSPAPEANQTLPLRLHSDLPGAPMPLSPGLAPSYPIGPFFSTSHLPTYYPPAPLQYTFTGDVRHPLRPKPPRMGEVFYTRFIPSQGQYLSFRVASLSPNPVPYLGPVGPKAPQHESLMTMSDTLLLQSWYENPRVNKFWGAWKENTLSSVLELPHSFPVIALWDGVPWGYFEVYWVKEDLLGKTLGSSVDDWDRGIHLLVGEEWARGRVPVWLSSLVHWCFTSEPRTMSVNLEPRIDNDRVLKVLDETGFGKERQISFPHKQSWLSRLRRETFKAPRL